MQTAALFDLDGVIVDTEGQYTEFWKRVGNQDFPNVPDFAFRIKGHTLTQILNAHYPDNEAAQKRVVEELNVFEQNMRFPYIAGAVDFVKALRQAGIPTAVVTSSNKAKMQCLYRCHPELPTLFDRNLLPKMHVAQSLHPIVMWMLQRRWGANLRLAACLKILLADCKQGRGVVLLWWD